MKAIFQYAKITRTIWPAILVKTVGLDIRITQQKNTFENQQNDKITEQILNMLEKFTERMLLLEKEVKHGKINHNE